MSKKLTFEEDFLQAYDQLFDGIFKHCYYRLSDREKAKELVQEAFMRTWEYLASGHVILNLKAFVYRTANNLIIDQYRKKKDVSLEVLQEAGFEPFTLADATIEQNISSDYLDHILGKLRPLYRQVVSMRYIEDLSPKEIAQRLNLTENVASVRIHRGLKKLKEVLTAPIHADITAKN